MRAGAHACGQVLVQAGRCPYKRAGARTGGQVPGVVLESGISSLNPLITGIRFFRSLIGRGGAHLSPIQRLGGGSDPPPSHLLQQL